MAGSRPAAAGSPLAAVGSLPAAVGSRPAAAGYQQGWEVEGKVAGAMAAGAMVGAPPCMEPTMCNRSNSNMQ